jgi:hypothetical protein
VKYDYPKWKHMRQKYNVFPLKGGRACVQRDREAHCSNPVCFDLGTQGLKALEFFKGRRRFVRLL